MPFMIDMRVAELLASRLCHDLVGPIGAVNNGMELLEDEDLGMSEDAIQLSAKSARQAANILQYYRLAYGMAGGRIGDDLGGLRDLATGFLESSKTTLDWTMAAQPAGDLPEGLGKLLLNVILLGEECLPRGGTLSVSLTEGPDGLEVAVTAQGTGARLREESQLVLVDDAIIEELTPRNVHGYFTRLLAQRMGSELTIDTSGTDSLRLSVTLGG
ncbi:MAG: histidine phosphotransferase family protein [Alphaproteobacteria bacterium]|nr:histidine phosphotransferase family protein [Alphaproteobacteria bacterium]